MKNKKKQKLYKRPKRTTFLKLFAKGAVCCLFATAIFAGMLVKFESKNIYEQVNEELSFRKSQFLTKFSDHENGSTVGNLDGYLSAYTAYNAMLDNGSLAQIMDNFEYWQYISGYSQNCYALSAIVDENQNILYSSKERLRAIIKFESGDAGWYVCELEEIPELWQAYQDMQNEIDRNQFSVDVKVNSAYIDTEHGKFIPHEAEVRRIHFESTTDLIVDEIRNITIESDNSDYELVTLNPINIGNQQYPMVTAAGFSGTEETAFNELFSNVTEYSMRNGSITSGMRGISGGRIYHTVTPVWIDGERNYLIMAFQISIWNEYIKKIYFTIVGIFFLCTLLIDLVYSLHKNKVNQLAYQFEDYQRTLINNLAHDLKTPLMAINGYAENLLTSCEMEQQPKEYLQSILENVRYTDSVINQTLELNQIQEIRTLQKSVCNLNNIMEKALRKYELLLDEHQITVTSVGDAEIMANPETLTSAIENLISNAVKYTPLGGEIKIQIGGKLLQISNNVSEKMETSSLLLPFAKGDKSRTGKSGSGLGLTIAENALRANGFKLEISCTEDEFTAEIHF